MIRNDQITFSALMFILAGLGLFFFKAESLLKKRLSDEVKSYHSVRVIGTWHIHLSLAQFTRYILRLVFRP